jgi:hypothetical protein
VMVVEENIDIHNLRPLKKATFKLHPDGRQSKFVSIT